MQFRDLVTALFVSTTLEWDHNAFCIQAKLALRLPECARTCLENVSTDGTCADNLKGFCNLSDGVWRWFETYGLCLWNACPADEDRCALVQSFKEDCASAGSYPKPLPEGWIDYLNNDEKCNRATLSVSQASTSFSSKVKQPSTAAQQSTKSSSTISSSPTSDMPSSSTSSSISIPPQSSIPTSPAAFTPVAESAVPGADPLQPPIASYSVTPLSPNGPVMPTWAIGITASIAPIVLLGIVVLSIILYRRHNRESTPSSSPQQTHDPWASAHSGRAELDGAASEGAQQRVNSEARPGPREATWGFNL